VWKEWTKSTTACRRLLRNAAPTNGSVSELKSNQRGEVRNETEQATQFCPAHMRWGRNAKLSHRIYK
jgi:hypothetical protein